MNSDISSFETEDFATLQEAAGGRSVPASALTGGARVTEGQSAHARASPATHAVSSNPATMTYVINDSTTHTGKGENLPSSQGPSPKDSVCVP